jgi:hypothetical protein
MGRFGGIAARLDRRKVLPISEIWGKIPSWAAVQEASMRALSTTAIMFVTLVAFADLAHADGTWCAFYGTGFSGRNCGFYSFEQCRASVSGIGGFCQPNNWTNPGEPRRRSPAR